MQTRKSWQKLALKNRLTIATLLVMNFSGSLLLASPSKEKLYIEVYKSRRLLLVKQGDHTLQKMPVALGRNPVGTKEMSGDNKTPEGKYIIDYRIEKSEYYKGLHISYPTGKQTREAKEKGVDPGGAILIHGTKPIWSWLGQLHTWRDWTYGCIAVSNDEMDLLFKTVPVGSEIYIYP